MTHVPKVPVIGDKVRIICGCIAGCYYEGGVFRPDLGKHMVEVHNRTTGRKDLVNVRKGIVTPLVREGRPVGRSLPRV